ncbi:unnamed protein product [Rhizophagus irregularis]|nr:unnamed protein product [Rhizophagus irregularis]CAB4495382.1 unnamed protein product [Rhizophagus irregularis]
MDIWKDITAEFLREIELHIVITSVSGFVNRCYEPKNAIDSKDNDSFKYSESIEAIDFTKLSLDKNN